MKFSQRSTDKSSPRDKFPELENRIRIVLFFRFPCFAQISGQRRVEATVVNDVDTNIVFIPVSLGPHCQKWFWSKKFTENTFPIQIMTFCIVSGINTIAL